MLKIFKYSKSMISIKEVFKKTRILAPEINSGEIMVEKEVCPSVREIAERFASGYDISEHIRNVDSGDFYNDDDIDNISNPQYDAEFQDYYQAAEDFRLAQEQSNAPKSLHAPEGVPPTNDGAERRKEEGGTT